MTTNALLPLAPRFFCHQLTSQCFLIPTPGKHTEDIVLTRTNHSHPGPVDGRPGLIPFWERDPLPKRTLPDQEYLFDDVYYFPDNDDQKASSHYTTVQGLSDTYERGGIPNAPPVVKGLYVDFYL